MTNNLEIWDRFADIDPKYTKAISGRDYGGTSPNPQYVIRCLTEMFGPVGKGFGWSVLAEEFKQLGDTHLHWCRIRFWWKDGGGEHGVEEYGQTKAAYMTSTGKHKVDEDAPKKSLTDAIIKGASHIGVAANIFLGRWDDQKYVAEVNQEYREQERSVKHKNYAILMGELNKGLMSDDIARMWKDAEFVKLRKEMPEEQQQQLHTEMTAIGKALKAKETAKKDTVGAIKEEFPGSEVRDERITNVDGREVHPMEGF